MIAGVLLVKMGGLLAPPATPFWWPDLPIPYSPDCFPADGFDFQHFHHAKVTYVGHEYYLFNPYGRAVKSFTDMHVYNSKHNVDFCLYTAAYMEHTGWIGQISRVTKKQGKQVSTCLGFVHAYVPPAGIMTCCLVFRICHHESSLHVDHIVRVPVL